MAKKILVIDDSALMRRVISDIISQGNDYEVAAIAKDGVEGFEYIVSNPNLYSAVILDINMPKMNGLELLEKLQKSKIEQTVIVVSTVAKQGAKETIRALELGAFDFVTKPENYLETKGEAFKKKIHEMLDIATASQASRVAGLKNIAGKQTTTTTRSGKSESTSSSLRTSRTVSTDKDVTSGSGAGNESLLAFRRRTQLINEGCKQVVDSTKFKDIKRGQSKIVALACSTGGPKSLQQVIPLIPANIDAPIVLVQHMPVGFTASLAARLNEMSAVKVKEASDGEELIKGNVYIAPGGRHTRVVRSGGKHIIKLSDEPAIEGLRPCANLMYESLVDSQYDEITCVVLTGMGSDGTKGIKGLAACHKKIHVISQDEDTCVVYGMPKAIYQSGLVNEVVPLSKVAEEIIKNVGVS